MQEYNPKLCDFGLITGGIFPDRTIYKGHPVSGCYGYIDLSALGQGISAGHFCALTITTLIN